MSWRSKKTKPGVVLALGSGSARGLAHVGILNVLLEAGVPIKGIAGSSIGAVVGGLQAGDQLDGWVELMRGMDRQSVLWFLDPVIPVSGLFGGRRTNKVLRSLLGDRVIEHLPLEFVAVATNLSSGTEIRIKEGDLVQAIRASYAIPGIFTPEKLDDLWLTDGGAVCPVPVAAAREMGFSKIIAVDLHGQSYGPSSEGATALGTFKNGNEPTPEAAAKSKQLLQQSVGFVADTAGKVAGKATRFWQKVLGQAAKRGAPGISDVIGDTMAFAQLTIAQRDLELNPPDLLLEPRLPNVGLFDYHRADELIAEGERCAREALAAGLLDPFIKD
ncbi:MAG: patatin-like phospholipase family protein [Planctomycetota bacterium]|jgi:NTE family protein|nr:patatin-like phospholipase family protein [Planctomycetota bacterium]